MAEGTAALRAAAPAWSLASDRQLLVLLQETHQRIIAKCNETNARLEEMARGLRDASVNLQNVNNKFLALSNTQFVESRVYEDDADVAPAPAHAEPPRLSELCSELVRLQQSLRVLQDYHEPLCILGDSSDSDSDRDDRLVLQPRNLYAARPLPHVIGSRAWRAKWHAGLVQEDSDSDSSEPRPAEAEQYSESEDDAPAPPRKISTDSSSIQSEAISVSPVQPSPSDVAAELARRLGGNVKIPEKEPLYEPETTTQKLYTPKQPVTATIFPDEPPSLDETSSDDDIFAELHKPRPNLPGNRVENDLFDFAPQNNSIGDTLFRDKEKEEECNEPSNEVFKNESKPQQATPETEIRPREDIVKKPIGGISLFGTNKHAETIGAAILKRNRRKSSTSGDETDEVKVKQTETKEVKKERDIFDDLFAKSEKLNKKSAKIDPNRVEPKVEVKKDAFSDLFDDIDDIFSTDIVNVKVKETKTNEKSLFSDDDDLFAEVSKVSNVIEKEKIVNKKSEVNKDVTNAKNNSIRKESQNVVIEEVKKESKGLFDSDSDDGLFTNVPKKIVEVKKVDKVQEPVEYKINDDIFAENNADDLFDKIKPLIKEKKLDNKNISKSTEISKTALFGSDDELFTNNVKENKTQIKDIERNDNIIKVFNSENKNALFDSDDDGLFTKNTKETGTKENNKNYKLIDNNADTFVATAKQSETKLLDKIESTNDSDELLFKTNEKSKVLQVVESINSDIFHDGDELFKKTEALKDTKIETFDESFDDEQLFSNKSLPNENDSITEPTQEETQSDESLNNDFESGTVKNDIIYKQDKQTENILRTTRIALDEENVETEKVKHALFSDSDDDLFKSTPVTKTQEADKYKYEDENTYEKIPQPKKPESSDADIFSDIFDDIPPIFEKPKESKKSRNVNALFDDDSDDEALFFKKNDPITDEKPDFNPSEERFGIFNDEPPAIDVDFTQKPNDFAPKPRQAESIQKVDVACESALKTDVIKETPIKKIKSTEVISVKDDRDTTDNTSKEPKKVGKLKPMNFNINVNTLLPGASPKKKQNDNTDEQTASNEDLPVTDKIEHKMVKSISFDDPEILDNKISKGRAKIQVKRRPSTRRARKEAVRKSAIDLTDSSYDVNDNKNNVKDKVVKTVYILNDDDIFGNKNEKNEHVSAESTKKHLNIVDSDEEVNNAPEQRDELDSRLTNDIINNDNEKTSVQKKSFLDSDDDDLFKNPTTKTAVKNISSVLNSDDNDDLFKQTNIKISSTLAPNSSKSSNHSDSKVEQNKKNVEEVYKRKTILDSDDSDDLFTNKNTKETITSAKSVNSDEDLFTNTKGIETLGKVYDDKNTKINNRESIFDDVASETKVDNAKINKVIEKANVEKAAVKKSILDDSSDEDDLFKARTTLTAMKNAKSLFGDDDDGDLFGTRTVKEPKQQPSIQQSSKEAKAEPVFEDPLSLFGSDE